MVNGPSVGSRINNVPVPQARPANVGRQQPAQQAGGNFTQPANTNFTPKNTINVRQTPATDNMTKTLPTSFPDKASGDPTIEQMATAIRAYEGSKATDVATSMEVARAAQAAAREFGVDPRQLLAVWARESQFDPKVSTGNGTGLGQITRPAVQELARISRGGSNGYRAGVSDATLSMLRSRGPGSAGDLFRSLDSASGANRRASLKDPSTNARVSAAYLRLMIDTNTRGTAADTTTTLRAYNGHGGSIERAYPGHIRDSYQDLWGAPLPQNLKMR